MKLVGRISKRFLAEQRAVRLVYPPYHVLVTTVDGEPRAIEDACNHAGASLAQGSIEDDCVICPMHGFVFSLRDGKLVAPAGLCDNQRTFRTTIEGDDVVVYDDFDLELLGT